MIQWVLVVFLVVFWFWSFTLRLEAPLGASWIEKWSFGSFFFAQSAFSAPAALV
jgi:hypothetical protein